MDKLLLCAMLKMDIFHNKNGNMINILEIIEEKLFKWYYIKIILKFHNIGNIHPHLIGMIILLQWNKLKINKYQVKKTIIILDKVI